MDRITVTLEGFEAQRAKLDALGKDAPRAITRALNRTGATGRTRSLRAIARLSGLPSRSVSGGVILRRATFSVQEARVEYSGRPMPLSRFVRSLRPRRPVRIPAGLTITPAGLRTPFVQTMPGASRPSIFARHGRVRLPISKLFGPSLQGLIGPSLPGLAGDLRAVLLKNLEHEIAFLAVHGTAASD